MKTLPMALLLGLFLAGSVVTASAQEWGTLTDRVMVEGMYRRNIGDFGDVWASASGVYVSYAKAFPDNNFLIFRTGYLSSKLADSVNYPDAKLDIVPLHLGGRYVFIGGRVMPFASIMMGLDVITENTALDGTKAERTHAKFTWELGAGVTVAVAGPVDVDLAAHYQSSFYTHEAMATGFSYTGGLAWNFNR